MSKFLQLLASALLIPSAACLDLNVSDQCTYTIYHQKAQHTNCDSASIKDTASTIAKGLYEYHNPSSTAGQFDQ